MECLGATLAEGREPIMTIAAFVVIVWGHIIDTLEIDIWPQQMFPLVAAPYALQPGTVGHGRVACLAGTVVVMSIVQIATLAIKSSTRKVLVLEFSVRGVTVEAPNCSTIGQ